VVSKGSGTVRRSRGGGRGVALRCDPTRSGRRRHGAGGRRAARGRRRRH
jgi:hypothetical protein